jgi:hypothetical protein
VDDTVNLGVGGKDLVEGRLVGDVDLVEGWSLSAEQLNSIQHNLGGVVQAVYDDDLVPMLEEGQGGEGSNVSGTTGRRETISIACSR